MTTQRPAFTVALTCGNGRIRASKPRRRRQPSRGVTDYAGVDMTHGICTMDECEKAHVAKGLCSTHYQRLKRLGSTALPPARRCSVDDCERKHFGRGYCNTHLKRLWSTGTLEAAPRVRKTCTFLDCGRPAVSRGLCTGHAQQAKRGVEIRALRPMWKSTVRDESGNKRCSGCSAWKGEEDFYPSPKQADGLTSWCKRCDRSFRLKRNYGITADQYDALLARQGGGCAICGGQPKDGPSLHIDHDHACCPTRKKSCGDCVRGLLCEDCNRVLGMFRDDTTRFEAAIQYLKREGP